VVQPGAHYRFAGEPAADYRGRSATSISIGGYVGGNSIIGVPDALRLSQHAGAITQLPGYGEGWWTVQDASAQLVGQLLAPQPGETVLDVCAAPGGKATHLAEMMGDEGVVWACDRTASRLKKVTSNCQRLQLTSVRPHLGDSTDLAQFHGQADRVLVDAPCSGLGTLHRHADARWRQTPDSVAELAGPCSTNC
jgi:16S rRNA (cytosine967-C5)-methyltransferase